MKNTSKVFLLAVLLFVLAPRQTSAETSVNISNNESGATSNVKVYNSINTSNASTNTSNSHTSVRIETNGQVKTYESDNGGSVYLESDDGTAKVRINNSIKSGNSETQKATSEGRQKIEAAKKKLEQKLKEQKEKEKDLFQKIKDFFKELLFGIKA